MSYSGKAQMIFQLEVIKENSIALEKKRIQENKTVVSNI